MVTKRELVLFIPGIKPEERDRYVTRFFEGLKEYCIKKEIEHTIEMDDFCDGSISRNIKIESIDKIISFREVFWSDLVPKLSQKSIVTLIVEGLALFKYWLSWLLSKKKGLNIAAKNKYMLYAMVFGILTIGIWYWGAISTVIEAIGDNPELFMLELPDKASALLSKLENPFMGWQLWLIAWILSVIMKAKQTLDTSYCFKLYMQKKEPILNFTYGRLKKILKRDGEKNQKSKTIYHKINNRVNSAINGIDKIEKSYDQVTVVAHSFGVVIATEVLALAESHERKIRLVTLGGPLEIAAACAPRVQTAIDLINDEQKVERWIDFWCESDWLCTGTPIRKKSAIYSAHQVYDRVEETDGSKQGPTKLKNIKQGYANFMGRYEKLKRFSNDECHFMYFKNEEIMHFLVTGKI